MMLGSIYKNVTHGIGGLYFFILLLDDNLYYLCISALIDPVPLRWGQVGGGRDVPPPRESGRHSSVPVEQN